MGVLQYSNGATMRLELGQAIAVRVWLYAMEVGRPIVCWTILVQRPRVHSSLLPRSQLVCCCCH